MITSARASQRFHPLLYPLAGGLVPGTLDIAYACIFWSLKAGVPAQRIFQSVAAGLLGKASFEGGSGTAALGLGLHYFIATTMAVVYYLAARRRPMLWRSPGLFGSSSGFPARCSPGWHSAQTCNRGGSGSDW